MANKLKIAIYSGVIPSSSFIENLIDGVAAFHTVLLFGVQKKKLQYPQRAVRCFFLPQNRLQLLCSGLWWILKLALLRNSDFVKLKKHIDAKSNFIPDRIRLWSKYAPIVYSRPDIFHLQWVKGLAEWIFLKERFEICLVVSFRGAHMNYSQVASSQVDEEYRNFLSRYDGFHAVSGEILRNALVYGINPERARIVFPAVQDQLLTQCRMERALHSPLKILSVGRAHWIKAYDVALDACHILHQSGLDFQYQIVAGGDHEELLFQIDQLGLSDRVKLMGELSQKQLFALYQEADLLVISSHAEGIPNVALEAMALGCPVLSTRCGGVEEVIENEVNGWLVPVRDPESMAHAIQKFAAIDALQLRRVIQQGYNRIQRHHLLSQQIAEMCLLYQNSLEKTV